jgi:hypothetical protein
VWREILASGKAVFDLKRSVGEHENDIKKLQGDITDLRRELQVLASAVQELRLQQQHDRTWR